MEWFITFITIIIFAIGFSFWFELTSPTTSVDLKKSELNLEELVLKNKKMDLEIKQLENKHNLISLFIDGMYIKLSSLYSLINQNTPRLNFNGIDVIDGTDAFISKLINIGFKKNNCNTNSLEFNGNFLNKTVTLVINKTPNTDLIYKIDVCFESYDSYENLNDEYVAMFNKLNEKYCECDNKKLMGEMFERVLDSLNIIDDTLDNCKYLMDILVSNTVIYSNQGIRLAKRKLDENKYCNVLTYIDPINFNIGAGEFNENKKKNEIDLTNL